MMFGLAILKEGKIVYEIVEENFMKLENPSPLSNFLVLIFTYRRIS